MEKLNYFTFALITIIAVLIYIVWRYWNELREAKSSIKNSSSYLQTLISYEIKRCPSPVSSNDNKTCELFNSYFLDLRLLEGILSGLVYKYKHSSLGLSMWQANVKACQIYFNYIKIFYDYGNSTNDKIGLVKNITSSIYHLVSEMPHDKKKSLNISQSNILKDANNFILISNESKEEDFEKLNLLPQALSLYAKLLNLDIFN